MRRFLIYTIFFANLAAILLLWWNGSLLFFDGTTDGTFIALGRLAGLLAMFFILVQLILVSRVPFIERAYGFDKLNNLHRILGYTLAATIPMHPILLSLGYAMSHGISPVEQFIDFISNWEEVNNALIGFIIILTAAVFALPKIRRFLKYETWRVTHLAMYFGIWFIFDHQTEGATVSHGLGITYWFALNFSVFGLILIYRFLRPFWLYYRHRFVVDRVERETGSVTSVYITGRDMEKFRYEAGQYINVVFLARGFLQPHPFSISVAPNGKYLRLSIRNSGDFTSRIPKLTPGTKVIVEGPLGRFTERAARTEKYLFIAGGIGITPIRAMAESIKEKGGDMIFVYNNRSMADVPLKSELDALVMNRKYVFSDMAESGHEFGKVTAEMIARFARDFRDRDVYICGPWPMMKSVIASLRESGVPKRQIHFEKFSY